MNTRKRNMFLLLLLHDSTHISKIALNIFVEIMEILRIVTLSLVSLRAVWCRPCYYLFSSTQLPRLSFLYANEMQLYRDFVATDSYMAITATNNDSNAFSLLSNFKFYF